MSTLKVNNLQDLGAGAVVTNGVVNASALPAGSILQVVSTTKTDTFSASVAASGGLSSDAMTASITPTDSGSKILITASLNVDSIGGGGNPVLFLYKDASVLTGAIGDAAGSRRRGTSGVKTGGSRTSITGSINYLDSPATTSSITYSVRLAHDSSSTQTIVLNRGGDDTDGANTFRTISTITLTEVAV